MVAQKIGYQNDGPSVLLLGALSDGDGRSAEGLKVADSLEELDTMTRPKGTTRVE